MEKQFKIAIGFLVIFFTVLIGFMAHHEMTTDKQYIKQTTIGEVLEESQLDQFDESAALMGYVAGGNSISQGLVFGAASASGCKIPALIYDKPVVIEEPSTMKCKELEPGESIPVERTKIKTTYTEENRTEISYTDWELQ